MKYLVYFIQYFLFRVNVPKNKKRDLLNIVEKSGTLRGV